MNARLFADALWFLGLLFICTTSENIDLSIIASMLNGELESLKKAMLSAITLHATNRFNTKNIDVDLEFNCLKLCLPIPMNIIDKDSYVYPAERLMCIVKKDLMHCPKPSIRLLSFALSSSNHDRFYQQS